MVTSMPSPSFYNANKTHLVREANIITAREAMGCMPYVRRHTLKQMVIYVISRTAYDAKGLICSIAVYWLQHSDLYSGCITLCIPFQINN